MAFKVGNTGRNHKYAHLIHSGLDFSYLQNLLKVVDLEIANPYAPVK